MTRHSPRGISTFAALTLFAACASVEGQNPTTPKLHPPDAASRKTIEKKTAKLGDAISALRGKEVEDEKFTSLADAIVADIEVFHQAATWIARHNEYFQKESAAWTIEGLDRGLSRVKQLESGKLDWLKTTGRTTVRGYRSSIDGSVQPYAVTLPENYGKEPGKKWRVDIVLHPRDRDLNEVKFLHEHGDKPAPKDLSYIKLDVFGRGNTGYRWAGEVDPLEAQATFERFEHFIGRGQMLDKRRQVLRGFSMGGAGTWQLGLHQPDRWCVIAPGGGFTATHGVAKDLPAKLSWPLEQCLRIYDAVGYAENAFNLPIVAYAGEDDPQLLAAKNIEERLKSTKFANKLQLLVAPGIEHQFPPEWQQKSEALIGPFVKAGRDEYPKRVRFVTYTLKYPACDWVEIIGMEKHLEKALVDAKKTEEGFDVATKNVDILRLRVPKADLFDMSVSIDNQKLSVRPWQVKNDEYHVYLQKKDGRWQATLPQKIAVAQLRSPRKVAGLQGPIDDAFTSPFLCVRAAGQPWSVRVDDYAEASLKRFQAEWAKYMRGDFPVKNDVDVTSEDIAQNNLILFGDPGSNTMIAHVLEGLPLKWSKEKLTIGDKTFPSATHVPVLVYPNPLNATRYVVLNSGHTFHAEDFQAGTVYLYPRFGDYAVLRLPAKGPALAVDNIELNGLFDESWQLYAGK